MTPSEQRKVTPSAGREGDGELRASSLKAASPAQVDHGP
jgi:hypothetical protein